MDSIKIDHSYEERITSNRTEALFVVLTFLFFALFVWQWKVSPGTTLSYIVLCFFVFFLFYSLNYRTLVIFISAKVLKLQFGIFAWTEPLDNIEACRLDDALSSMMRFGGAGIHFMTVDGRYRANFNFLEYPRVVVRFRRKRGLVSDLSFSTQRPDEVIKYLNHGFDQDFHPQEKK
jgi:hypothetical protein